MRPKPPEMPDDPLEDMEPPSISIMTNKTREELDTIPYLEKLWTCAAEGCTRCTTVRDYGHFERTGHVYWRRRFMNLYSYYYLCGRHTKIERRWLQQLNKTQRHEVADIVKSQPFPLKPRREHFILTIKIPKL